MADKIRVRFFGDGVTKEPTGHLYLRWLPEDIWRFSIWDSVSNERTTTEGTSRLDGGAQFCEKLTDADMTWHTGQQKATDVVRENVKQFSPEFVGYFQNVPMKAKTSWTRHMNAVKLTQVNLQKEVVEAQHALFTGNWHTNPFFDPPTITFGYPWK